MRWEVNEMSKELAELKNEGVAEHFLYLVRRIYTNRDELRASSEKMVDLSYRIEACTDKNKLTRLFREMDKELNRIISCINELSPHLRNPSIIDVISDQARLISAWMSDIRNSTRSIRSQSLEIRQGCGTMRIGFIQNVNGTDINVTPKSIKTAYGIEIGWNQAKIRAFIERVIQNY
jgi:hypothetical protein